MALNDAYIQQEIKNLRNEIRDLEHLYAAYDGPGANQEQRAELRQAIVDQVASLQQLEAEAGKLRDAEVDNASPRGQIARARTEGRLSSSKHLTRKSVV